MLRDRTSVVGVSEGRVSSRGGQARVWVCAVWGALLCVGCGDDADVTCDEAAGSLAAELLYPAQFEGETSIPPDSALWFTVYLGEEPEAVLIARDGSETALEVECLGDRPAPLGLSEGACRARGALEPSAEYTVRVSAVEGGERSTVLEAAFSTLAEGGQGAEAPAVDAVEYAFARHQGYDAGCGTVVDATVALSPSVRDASAVYFYTLKVEASAPVVAAGRLFREGRVPFVFLNGESEPVCVELTVFDVFGRSAAPVRVCAPSQTFSIGQGGDVGDMFTREGWDRL